MQIIFNFIKTLLRAIFISPFLFGLYVAAFWIRTVSNILDALVFTSFAISSKSSPSSKIRSFFNRLLDFLFGISLVKWIVRKILFRSNKNNITNSSNTSPSLPFFYKNICSECESKIFDKARFPRSIVIIEPPHLSTSFAETTNTNTSNSKNAPPPPNASTSFEYPKTLKYALSHPTSLTIQLFCHLYGIPFAVEQSDETFFLASSSFSKNSNNNICPIFIKIDNVNVIKGKDSSHLIEQLFKALLPFGSQVDAPELVGRKVSSSSSNKMMKSTNATDDNEQDDESTNSILDSGVEGDEEDDNNNNNNDNENESKSSILKRNKMKNKNKNTSKLKIKTESELLSELPQCCQMRYRLVSLFGSVGDPLTCGISGQLSSSDAHRNVNLRRIIDASITPFFEHVLKNGISIHSCASGAKVMNNNNDNNNKSDSTIVPLIAHPRFLSFLSSSSVATRLKKSLVSTFLGTNHREETGGGGDSFDLFFDQLVLHLNRSETVSSSSASTVDRGFISRTLDKVKLLCATSEGIIRIMLLSKIDNNTMGGGVLPESSSESNSSTSYSEIFDELVQNRLKEDLSLLERFIAATASSSNSASTSSSSSATIIVGSSNDDNNQNEKQQKLDQGSSVKESAPPKFLFDSPTPTIADCAVLSICLAAVHSEQIPGFYSSLSSSSTTTSKKELKLHALEDFVRRRSVKKYMERCLFFFYPGSVANPSTSSSKKNKHGSGGGGGGGNNDDDNDRDSQDKKQKITESSFKNNNKKKDSTKSKKNNKDEHQDDTHFEASSFVVSSTNENEKEKRRRSRSAAARTAAREQNQKAAQQRRDNLSPLSTLNTTTTTNVAIAMGATPLPDEQQTSLDDTSKHLFGSFLKNNSNGENCDLHHQQQHQLQDQAPDTDAHNEDDDDGKVRQHQQQTPNSNKRSPSSKAIEAKTKTPTTSTAENNNNNNYNNNDDYYEIRNISPPASPLLKRLVDQSKNQSKTSSLVTSMNSSESNTSHQFFTNEQEHNNGRTTLLMNDIAAAAVIHPQLTVSHRDLKKVVSGTHVRSPHNRERSWLKRSASDVFEKATQRKQWESEILRGFENIAVVSGASSVLNSANASNQCSTHVSH